MSFIRRLFGLEERAIDPGTLWAQGIDLIAGSSTVAGRHVSIDSALQVSAVWGCHRILTDNVVTLPIDAVRVTEEPKPDGTLLRVVNPERPAPPWLRFDAGPQRRSVFMTQVMMSLLSSGNAYAAVYRSPAGTITNLEVLDPAVCEPEKVGSTVMYRVNGQLVTSYDVLHVPGLMKPGGLEGLSPIAYARETVGLAQSATEFGSSFFTNGAFPGGIVETPGPMTAEGIANLKAQWNDLHRGTGNAHKMAVITEGAKFAKVSVNPEDAQFLQTRSFQVADIARIYGVPPHLLADSTGSTSWGSGLAEQNQAFLQQSLTPWVVRIEEGLSWLLWSEGRPRTVRAKFDPGGLLRAGAFEERMSAYSTAVQAGILTIDEVREEIGRPPLPEGEGSTPIAQLNLAPLDKLGAMVDEGGDGDDSPPPDDDEGPPNPNEPAAGRSGPLAGEHRFNPGQPRAKDGKWTKGSAGAAAEVVATFEEQEATGKPVGITARPTASGRRIRTMKKGYVVAVPNSRTTVLSPETQADRSRETAEVRRYLDENAELLASSSRLNLGAWREEGSGELYLDIVEVFPDRQVAVDSGRARGEIAVWDLAKGEEIPTGGTGGRENLTARQEGHDEQAHAHDGREGPARLGGAGRRGEGRLHRRPADGDRRRVLAEVGGRRRGVEPRFNPSQPRAKDGKWTKGGAGGAIVPVIGETVAGRTEIGDMRDDAMISAVGSKMESTLEERCGVTDKEAGENYDALFERAKHTTAYDEGMVWYDETHNSANRMADDLDVDLDTTAGVIAATSPGRQWLKNGRYENLELAEATIRTAKAHPDWSADKVASAALASTGFGTRDKRGIVKGVRIVRGESPDSVLRGPKERSFYNNIRDPHGSRDKTIDGHMFNAARGDKGPRHEVKKKDGYPDDWEPAPGAYRANSGTKLTSTPKYRGAAVGAAPLLARHIDRIADREGLEPQQVQAILWSQQKLEHPEEQTRDETNKLQAQTDALYLPVGG